MAQQLREGTFKGHVMLSYSQKQQVIVLKIAKKLQDNGILVWIDTERMEENILDKMAEAVEGCSIFIMAVSKDYNESRNCKLEAGYAHQLKKPIIPLIVEDNQWKPYGWLGLLMSNTFYYDFSGKTPFEDAMSLLLRTIIRPTTVQQPSAIAEKTTTDTDNGIPMNIVRPLQRLQLTEKPDNSSDDDDEYDAYGTSGATATGGHAPPRGHVMLSYSWKHQKVVRKICQELKKAGIPVWMDVDHMEGSASDVMEEAVEDCSIFLMAVSPEYRSSKNCKKEATYADKNEKIIIPLIMKKNYQPDGWLGLLQGDRLYYDFSGKRKFNTVMNELLCEMKEILSGEKYWS